MNQAQVCEIDGIARMRMFNVYDDVSRGNLPRNKETFHRIFEFMLGGTRLELLPVIKKAAFSVNFFSSTSIFCIFSVDSSPKSLEQMHADCKKYFEDMGFEGELVDAKSDKFFHTYAYTHSETPTVYNYAIIEFAGECPAEMFVQE